MKKGLVITVIILIVVGILGWDVFLYNDSVDRNSITQIVIDLSRRTHLIPWLVGFGMGFLTCHFFEES